MTDEDPNWHPFAPHPAEIQAPRRRAVGPTDEEIIRRIKASPEWEDFCTCMIGTYPGMMQQRKKKKCCTACDACGCRVKKHYEKIHCEKCVAYRESLR